MCEVLLLLSREGLSDDAKKDRDYLLKCLDEHFHDVNASVRQKVLVLWGRLQQESAIPIAIQDDILENVIERIKDKLSSVRKQAISTFKLFVEFNPYAASVSSMKIYYRLLLMFE